MCFCFSPNYCKRIEKKTKMVADNIFFFFLSLCHILLHQIVPTVPTSNHNHHASFKTLPFSLSPFSHSSFLTVICTLTKSSIPHPPFLSLSLSVEREVNNAENVDKPLLHGPSRNNTVVAPTTASSAATTHVNGSNPESLLHFLALCGASGSQPQPPKRRRGRRRRGRGPNNDHYTARGNGRREGTHVREASNPQRRGEAQPPRNPQAARREVLPSQRWRWRWRRVGRVQGAPIEFRGRVG